MALRSAPDLINCAPKKGMYSKTAMHKLVGTDDTTLISVGCDNRWNEVIVSHIQNV